jgi:cell division protein FtsI/penicillin-binding protein 2
MKNTFSWRYLTLAVIMGLVGVAVLFQILRVQASPEVAGLTGKGVYVWKTFYPPRGEIYDRYGNLLAGNKTVYEVGVDLTAKPNVDTVASAATMTIGIDLADARARITDAPEGTQYIVLKDFVTVEQAQALMTMQEVVHKNGDENNLDSIHFKAHLARSYPEKDLASNILGFVTADNHGYLGVEEKYDNILAGIPVTKLVPADPRLANEYPKIPSGQTIILTIDREIQASIQEILDNAISDTGSSSGTIVVMDPHTGEILGMTSSPRMDLNDYTQVNKIYPGETPFNRAISQAYEPGSVAKIFTMAAALDTGTETPTSPFYDTGVVNVGGRDIYNWDGGAWGWQDMTSCMAHSLNVCLASVAKLLGNDVFYAYMQRFGLGHPTGIDLAGEVSGRLKLPGDGDWYQVDLGTNSFGQGVAITPIQMLMGASAFANDGKMVYPHVLLGEVQDGRQNNTSPQVVGTPVTAKTAHDLSNMLAISLEGESTGWQVDGYEIAGKTGTAQIPVEGGYDPDNINASFIGWGPVDNPRFLVYVWLEKPQSNKAASVVAAPVFKQVIERLIVLMDIPPDLARLQNSGQ